jgi:serine/threonine protein kinase/tetratricopeptide (TPR) repeat protein
LPGQDSDDITRTYLQLAPDTLIGHYRIIEKIGAGGMGEVYLAEDTKLDRKVALKFLPQHLCQNADCRARFTREAQATAKLSHPNIVTIFEVSDFNGRPFFAMELVEGQTLKEVIAGKPLPMDRIIEIGIQVCEGLQAAHEKGITHRDIKPSNILIDSHGRARIVDFGLASVLGTDQLTKTGSTLGTIGYMSPEQVRGDKVDQRTDLFSFGVVLYEMITGHSPFKADSEAATLHAITNTKPDLLARYRREVPVEIQTIIDKALEKDVATRYQHADDIVADLKRIAIKELSGGMSSRKPRPFALAAGVALALVVLTAAGYFYLSPKSHDTHGKSIAIMPFADMSQQKDQEYFCDGMTDELISRLSNVHTLRVPARTSVFMFKGKSMDIRQIGEQLKVETVLEGSVQRSGDKLRITAQLINVADGYHLWSQTFDREFKDVFAIQDDITTAITEKLRVTLLAEERIKLTKAPTDNVEAYNLYLLGQFHRLKYSEEGAQKSIECFDQAIAKDSNFALAWAGRSLSYWDLFGDCYRSRSETYDKAKAAALRAVALDADLGIAHAALGCVKKTFEWDFEGAGHEIELANELSPDDLDVLHVYCNYLLVMGRFEEAIAGYQRRVELDPASPAAIYMLGEWGYNLTGQYDKAIPELKRVLNLDPHFEIALQALAMAYAFKGVHDSALAMADSDLALSPITDGEILRMGNIAWVYAVSGREHDAHRLLERVLNIRQRRYVDAYFIATIYAGLKEYDTAWKWLSTAYEERAAQMTCLGFDPPFAEMRKEPRVKELLKKMGFPAK